MDSKFSYIFFFVSFDFLTHVSRKLKGLSDKLACCEWIHLKVVLSCIDSQMHSCELFGLAIIVECILMWSRVCSLSCSSASSFTSLSRNVCRHVCRRRIRVKLVDLVKEFSNDYLITKITVFFIRQAQIRFALIHETPLSSIPAVNLVSGVQKLSRSRQKSLQTSI